MASTPKRGVHWDINDLSPSLLDSPFVEGSTQSYVSTSSLEYLNAQLVAHGYTSPPGLSIEGLSTTDSERLIKCLLGMLSQRMGDMSRTEELSTKLRTLTYDHDRLQTMHRAANEKAANAERETNVHKTRLTATLRTLQTTEATQKNTTAELQRTRTSLQALRATHISELKKKEKDIERMTEKWSKIAEAQTKLTVMSAGMRCANATVDGSGVIGKSQSYLEIALEEAERARTQLMDESTRLRRLVLKVVNQVQALLHQARCFISDKEEEPSAFTSTTLFPMQPPTYAHDTLTTILNSLRDCLVALPQHIASSPSTSVKPPETDPDEIVRLQGIIARLREDVEQSQKQTLAQAAKTQAMFDQFVTDQQKTSENIAEMSMELMTVPMRDEEQERLHRIRRELDEEREKYTQAAITLGKERAALEAERTKITNEKRSWQVQMMLADLPPTPNPPSPHNSPRKSPKKSPKKAVKRVSTANSSSRKTTRVSRRPSITPVKMIPSYETEVLAPLPAPSFSSLKSAASILPSFVLPPPSPYASLPNKPILPLSNGPPDEGPIGSGFPPDSTSISSTTESPPDNPSLNPDLTTPIRRPFPMAKPLAQRMIHAYSPAKPSPLSRILRLAQSPSTPEGDLNAMMALNLGLEAVREEDEHPFPAISSVIPEPVPEPQMSLAAELGVESPPREEKKVERERGRADRPSSRGTGAETKKPVVPKSRPRPKTSEGTRGTVTTDRTSGGLEKEKENGLAGKNGSKPSNGATATSVKTAKPASGSKSTVAATVGTRNKVVPKPASTTSGGGPRRVPVNSTEAPPMRRRGS